MIRIQQHLDLPNSDAYLDGLALKMWNQLNLKTKANVYRVNSLIKKLDRLIIKTDTHGYLMNIAANNQHTLNRHKAFLSYLKDNEYDKLKKLIVNRPSDLVTLKGEILNILVIDDLYFEYNGGYKQTIFGELLIDELFSYNNFRKTPFCREIMIDAGFENITCPYCNDARINIIDVSEEEDEGILLRAYLDLDHFFSKSQNPYFAISFYNLIPSCHNCNSTEKGDKIFNLDTHTQPYVESFNEIYKFEINPNFFLDNSTRIINLTNISDKVNFSSRDFRLQQRYQGIHLKNVNDLIRLYINYQNYRNSPNFGHDWQEALLQNIPIESRGILHRPQGKLLRDVMLQIDIFGLIEE